MQNSWEIGKKQGQPPIRNCPYTLLYIVTAKTATILAELLNQKSDFT